MMGVAQGVGGTIVEVGFPVVMTEDALGAGEDSDFVKGLSSAFLMRVKIAVAVGRGVMQPIAGALGG
jgi:hypothetical protein